MDEIIDLIGRNRKPAGLILVKHSFSGYQNPSRKAASLGEWHVAEKIGFPDDKRWPLNKNGQSLCDCPGSG
jgi:hypothetical protein